MEAPAEGMELSSEKNQPFPQTYVEAIRALGTCMELN